MVHRAAAANPLDIIRRLREAGVTFNGARDLYAVLGYDRDLSTAGFCDRYARGGLSKRIVDVFPNATWRGEVELIEDEDPEVSTAFEQTWDDLDIKHQIQAKLRRVDTLAGLSTYAVLLIGAAGKLDEELPKGSPDKLLFLQPYLGGGGGVLETTSRRAVSTIGLDAAISVLEYDTDIASERYAMPLYYQLHGADTTHGVQPRVHWSRIIHIAEGCLQNEVFGIPSLEAVWNLLDDLDKVTGGGSEAYWLRANQGMHLDIDKDLALEDAKNQVEALKAQSESYKHQMTRWLRTRGVTATPLGSDVSDFTPSAEGILTQIAGTKGIPKRILTGSEMGELASSQDRENWRDQIVGRQKGYAGPYIMRRLVERLIAYGYLPEPKKGPREYTVRWPNIQALTETERMAGAVSWASTKTQEGGVFTNAEIRDKWYEMTPLTPEQQELSKPAPPPQQLAPGEDPLDEDAEPVDGEDEDEDEDERKFPRAARATWDMDIPRGAEEMVRVLEAAIIAKNPDVISRILGMEE